MQTTIKKISQYCLTVSLCLFACISLITAEPYSREGKGYELFVFGQSMSGDETSGLGIDIAFESANVWGAGGGYSGDYFNVNMDMFFGYMGWSATGDDISMIDQNFTLTSVGINVDGFLMYQISPLVTIGAGIITLKNEEIDITESNLSFNMGAGVRWDIMEQIFVKGLYRLTWTKLEDTNKSLCFAGVSIFIGYIF